MREIITWLSEIGKKSRLFVKQVSIAECSQWSIKHGALMHDSGHFFSIKGLNIRSNSPMFNGISMPMIDQPEVGILSFLIRSEPLGIVEWLLQAKTEPGAIGGTQIAPTIQATFSNYSQLHGGAATKYLDVFNKNVVSDSAQSEQGTRFLWKFNRNNVSAVSFNRLSEPSNESCFRWVSSCVLRDLLSEDFTVNTDARSVLASTEWCLLSEPNKPLFKSRVLQASYGSNERNNGKQILSNSFWNARMRWEFKPLDDLPGWRLDDDGVHRSDYSETVVSCFEVSLDDREIDHWFQPLMVNTSIEQCFLFMRFREGVAEFWVQAAKELGFGGRSEFGPSFQSNLLGHQNPLSRIHQQDSLEVISIKQSDEGSRFYHCTVTYSIVLITNVDVDFAAEADLPGAWFNLASLQALTLGSGQTTNELRTLISLVLSNEFDLRVKVLEDNS